jgi:histidinol-phosphate aminotransferase
MTLRSPLPKPSVSDPLLTRPDWLKSDDRDPKKLWLDKNENVDPDLARIVREVVRNIPPEAYWTYPDTARLYRKLAMVAAAQPANLILAAGSDGIIRSIFEAYISPGDVVIHTEPTFAMYGVYAQMYGAKMMPIHYVASQAGPKLPLDELLAAIRTTRPRLVCLPNPDSPTGTLVEPAELRTIIEAAGEAGAVILIDEAYYPFHRDTAAPWIAEYPHLAIARSTGKAWGMAGLRVGYGIAAPDVAMALHKVRPMYEISTVAAWAFDGMLDHVDDVMASVHRLNDGKRIFLDAMDDLGLRTLRGAGNFLHVAFGNGAAEIHAALNDLVYYRRDFGHPSLAGFSRFSAATPAQFRPIIDRIKSTIGHSIS